MAQAAVPALLFPQANPELQVLCCTASSLKQIKMIETEFIGAVPLFALANATTPEAKTAAYQMLNAHMEDFMDIMDDQEEFSEKIAFENSFPNLELGGVDTNFDPVLKGETPRIAVIASGSHSAREATSDSDRHVAQAHARSNTGASEYTRLITFITYFSVDANIRQLKNLMQYMSILLYKKFSPPTANNIRIYNNIYFVKNPVYDNSVFPKFSFYIVCKKEPLLQSQLLAGRENGMGALLKSFVCVNLKNFFNAQDPDFVVLKIIEPTESSHLWQVKLSIFGNDFIFISIQIINMADGYFTIEASKPVDYDITIDVAAHPLTLALTEQVLTSLDRVMAKQPAIHLLNINIWQNLCFSLYNKCLSKDFNCLCSLSESDIKLYKLISNFPIAYDNQKCAGFYQFINNFWRFLFDSQLIIKQKYFYLGLNNLVYCSCQSDYTPETKAYERLFDMSLVAGDEHKNLFVNSMRLIEYVNTICNAIAGEEKIRFVMGGGKQYSLFQKALHKFFSHVGEAGFLTYFNDPQFATFIDELRQGNVKAAADADFGMFYPDGAIGATQCMAVCMLLQLSLKVLFDNLLTAATYEIDIGNSCIGTPPTTLSSLREVIVQSNIYYPINEPDMPGYHAFTDFVRILTNFDTRGVKSTISPFDFVQKGSMVSYIKHIIHAVCDFIPQEYDEAAANTVAVHLSYYCMVTSQGFSSPLKGIFDIFYTLFIIENFTNRALVTQKINKELRRVAICAQVLYIHYRELLTTYPGNAAQINPMLITLKQMITYGYTNISLMTQDNFQTIMVTYCQFVSHITNYTHAQNNAIFLYYCINPPVIPPNDTPRALTRIETFFNSLLENSYNGAADPANPTHYPSKVLPPQIIEGTFMTVDRDPNFAAKITPCLHSINSVLTALQVQALQEQALQEQAIFPYVTLLYNNKLYAACRDSKNKSEGIVAIVSAYQSFLWDIRKRDRIFPHIRGEEHYVDLCQAEYDQLPAGADLLHSYGVAALDNLITSLNPCWAPNLNLLDLTVDDTLDDITFNTVLNDNKIKFLFFSWFITSIFGIKTKSKNMKVVSLGRTYLKLFMESNPGIHGMRVLFACNISIPEQALAAQAAQARLPEVPYNPLDNFPCNDDNILCLAYKDSNVRDALTKYRESQDRLGGPDSGVQSVKKIQNAPQVIGIMFDRPVFKTELVGLLIGRFSKIPRGQEFIHRTANKMKIIMDNFLDRINSTPVGRSSNLFDIVNHCLLSSRVNVLTLEYTPHSHDILKFDDLPNIPDISGQCSGQNLRNRWVYILIFYIINIFSVSTAVIAPIDDIIVRNLFNYIRLLIVLYKHLSITQESLAGIQYVNRTQPINPLLIEHVKQEVNKVFTVACIEEKTIKASAPPKASVAKASAASKASAVPKASAAASAAPKASVVPKASAASKAYAASAASAVGKKNAAPRGGTIRTRNPRSPKKTNNHTRKNKYKRNNKNKKQKSSPKYRKVNPSSRSGSQSNRKKSKSKLPHKNVTFKRRRYNNK